ncbi:oleosin Ara h 10.0102 [Ziziphus jujuba]|uniref:Oleosin Ara h 10.0102 n=1 Tax=Ziziphus jujuba TaxID=326968 RepID=A0A6P3ZUY3_ZIZJJ|nr:oleosin Ara h 10.0102 [Ziziphus jujuba]
MADRPQPHQIQVHPQHPYGGVQHQYGGAGGKNVYSQQQHNRGPSTSQVLAVLTLLPVGGTLLALAGITLTGTIIGLAVTTPLFLIFSPVLVPAGLTIGLAVAAFLTSGAFGLTGLSSLSWFFNFFRQATGSTGSVQEQLDRAKKRMLDVAEYTGHKTKDVGQEIQTKAQEGKRSEGVREK